MFEPFIGKNEKKKTVATRKNTKMKKEKKYY